MMHQNILRYLVSLPATLTCLAFTYVKIRLRTVFLVFISSLLVQLFASTISYLFFSAYTKWYLAHSQVYGSMVLTEVRISIPV